MRSWPLCLTTTRIAIGLALLGALCESTRGDDGYTPGPVVELHEWLGDQCSFVPDLDVGHCCAVHDVAYQVGGNEFARLRADLLFRKCIRDEGRPVIANIYYWGVRTFGWLFFNYR